MRESCDHDGSQMDRLDTILTDFYYGNFSVFQSLPDLWAIDQIFPVMPVHRLKEKPTRNAVLSEPDGLWGCTFVGECTAVCPKHGDPAGAIQQYKLQSALDTVTSFLLPRGTR